MNLLPALSLTQTRGSVLISVMFPPLLKRKTFPCKGIHFPGQGLSRLNLSSAKSGCRNGPSSAMGKELYSVTGENGIPAAEGSQHA
jgi:hypothetical protein